ncbi:MAG: PHP domain-containing protein [Verrucomicrobiae bacterium]|nr:PHP domain-containing protein [Verrucomicrobiae bacterium]
MKSVALTDVGNLHGAVEFAQSAKKAGIKPIFGAEICVNANPLLLFVESATGYHNLNQILSQTAESVEDSSVADQQRRRHSIESFANRTDGLIAVSPDKSLAELFPNSFYELATKETKSGRHPVVACPVNDNLLPIPIHVLPLDA